MRTVFVVPTYDPNGSGSWGIAIESILNQKRPADKIFVVIDDANYKEMGLYLSYNLYRGVCIIRCEKRNYSLKNIFSVLRTINFSDFIFESTDIICLLDGDDWLNSDDAIDMVRSKYEAGCWLTYGSFIRASDSRVLYDSYLPGEDFRTSPWRASHLKTFLYGLWKHVPEEVLRDANGEFFRASVDQAIMFPMLEMAGHDRICHIPDPIVFYDDDSPLNIHHTDLAKEQGDNEIYIRSLSRFDRLESL